MNKILPETTESPFCFSASYQNFQVWLRSFTAEIVNWTVYHIYSCQQFASSFDSCNMGTSDLPDMYAQSPRAAGRRGWCKTWTLDWTVDWTMDWSVDCSGTISLAISRK